MKQSIFLAYTLGTSSVSDYFSRLATHFAASYNVVIVTDGSTVPKDLPPEIEIYHWPSKRPTTIKDFQFLRKLVRQHKPKMMLSTFGANNMFLLVGYLLGVPNRIGTYRTLSTQYKSVWYTRLRKRWIYSLATKVIANSTATKEDLRTTYKIKESKVEVVPNAVRATDTSYKKDAHKIVYVGRLDPSKGMDVLLEAFRRLSTSYPKLRLDILGGTQNDIESYRSLSRKLKIDSQVSFKGSRPKEEVLEAFGTASFAVVPSLAEAFGFVVIEAFSVKTTVVGSRTGGIQETIRDGVDGLLFTPGDAEDLCAKMKILLESPALLEDLSQNAYRRFSSTYELDGATAALYEKLNTLISK